MKIIVARYRELVSNSVIGKGVKEMANRWNDILTREQLETMYSSTAQLDARFASEQRKFWETRTVNELHSLKGGAWYANDVECWQLARSYLELAS